MTGLKSLLLRALPEPLLFHAKRLHYPGVVRGFRPPHAAILRALIGPGDRVMDVGANIGWYTRAFSELVGATGRVLSVEPVPPTFALLSHCVRRLGLANVELFNCALSDGPGSAVMEVPRYSGGGENFYMARIIGGTTAATALRTFGVAVTSIDALLGDQRDRLAFVKCDVEGHELAVVRGAGVTLGRWKPGLLVEVGDDPDDPGSSAHALASELADLGYAAFWFDGHGLVRRQAGQRAVDYFFLTAEQVARVRRVDVRVA
ncbi:MAG: FkbM family methyltransferase [Candidatus Rokuibacteriota bacterium]